MIMSASQSDTASRNYRPLRDPAVASILSRVTDKGESSIRSVDEANIPVNIVFSEPDEFNANWVLLADNFRPCNSSIDIEIYELEASSKDDLLAVVRQVIAPLYRNAVEQLETHGHLFFWSGK